MCVCVCVSAGVQELRPALDLLCSAVRDSHSEAQSRQFSEQLLSITMCFVSAQVRSVLTNTPGEAALTHMHARGSAAALGFKLPDVAA